MLKSGIRELTVEHLFANDFKPNSFNITETELYLTSQGAAIRFLPKFPRMLSKK